MSAAIRGVVPPVVTPLTEDRELDRESLERSLERMLDAGVHGLFALGSSGEVVFSTDARRDEILSATVQAVAGRVPVLAGVIDMQTERVIEHTRRAADLGADAVVATAPFYALGGEREMEEHFRAIAASTELPVYAYDIPVCVHRKLGVELLVRLGAEGVIAGVKDSSGDDVSFRQLVIRNREEDAGLALLTGHEVVVDGAYLAGADGSVPGLGNVDPAGYVRQWDAAQRGDWQAVSEEQDRLTRLMRIAAADVTATGFGAGVGSFKTALRELGVFTTNQMPRPVAAQGEEAARRVREILTAEGMLGA
ncbi:MAG: dihydrodipicolinate synthase family protein [bacterium]|nr:dihydrodipicolinate synthase family protein [bacterium]